MKLYLVTVRPVQEVAAEPDTLEALAGALRTAQPEQRRAPGQPSPIGSLTGWPLVADPSLPLGFVYLRPSRRPNHERDAP